MDIIQDVQAAMRCLEECTRAGDPYMPEVSWCVQDADTWDRLQRMAEVEPVLICYRHMNERPYVIETIEVPGLRAQFSRPLRDGEVCESKVHTHTWPSYTTALVRR